MDRYPFTKELRIPDQRSGRRNLMEAGFQDSGRAHRHGRLAYHYCPGQQVWGQCLQGCVDVGEVGTVIAAPLRGSYADHVH